MASIFCCCSKSKVEPTKSETTPENGQGPPESDAVEQTGAANGTAANGDANGHTPTTDPEQPDGKGAALNGEAPKVAENGAPEAEKVETAETQEQSAKKNAECAEKAESAKSAGTAENAEKAAETSAEPMPNESAELEPVPLDESPEVDDRPMPPTFCSGKCCDESGISFGSPQEALRGAREKVIMVTCVSSAEERKPDALMTVDVDPQSPTYCQVLHKLDMPHVDDEIHHSGWNACAGCHGDGKSRRTHLVLPCLHSSRIYIVKATDPTNLQIAKIVEPKDYAHFNMSVFHTTHCMPRGDVIVSALGDANGDNRGDFLLLDGKTFAVKGRFPASAQVPPFHYDFWYQPRLNVLISTEWGSPNAIKKGFNPADVEKGLYGNGIHIWDYTTGKLLQSVQLHGPTGWIPLEVRFLHEPSAPHAFVGTALGSAVYHIYKENSLDPWQTEVAFAIPAKEVQGWCLPQMPALISDIIVSMDDRFMYVACWFFGEIRQYDIRDPFHFKLVGRVAFGGQLQAGNGVTVTRDPENYGRVPPLRLKGVTVQGGPQMMQLSLDGRRLYVTNSLYSVWDKQFYPEMSRNGGQMLKIDVDVDNGGMTIDTNFVIDFGKLSQGPYCPHEMRYPGGDCTSDIFV